MIKPLLLGHRGARAIHQIPENTLASFDLCLRHGCDGFEFDVRRSADGEAVICHDATIGAMKIESTASKSLLLPTLENVLRQFAHRAFLDIELKVAGLESQTLAELRKHHRKRDTSFRRSFPRCSRRSTISTQRFRWDFFARPRTSFEPGAKCRRSG